MLERRKTIFLEIEAVYGKDAGPVAADAIFVQNLAWSHQPTMIEQPDVGATIGTAQSIYGGNMMQITCDVNMKGSGAAGTPPEFAKLLRICGLDETIVASTSVAYGPVSAAFESGTIYFYEDGVLRKLFGGRGTFTFNGTAKDFGKLSFTITGHTVEYGVAQAGAASSITLDANSNATDDVYNGQTIRIVQGTGRGQSATITDYVGATKVATVSPVWTTVPDATSVYEIDGGPIDQAFPAVTYSTVQPPAIRAANFSVGGYAAVINALTFDMGLQVSIPPNWNSPDGNSDVFLTKRNVTGSFDPERTTVAVNDWEGDWKANSQMALDTGEIGQSAGNLWRIQMPKVNYVDPARGERESISIYELGFEARETTGDDELTITFT